MLFIIYFLNEYSGNKNISKTWLAHFCNKEDKEQPEMQVTHRRCRGTCGGFKRQNFQPSQMYRLWLLWIKCTSVVLFFHKESTNIVPVQLKSAMWHSNIFFYKATFTVWQIVSGLEEPPAAMVCTRLRQAPWGPSPFHGGPKQPTSPSTVPVWTDQGDHDQLVP